MWGNGCRSPTRPWDGPGHVRRHAGRMVVREVGEDAGTTWLAGEPVGKIGIERIRPHRIAARKSAGDLLAAPAAVAQPHERSEERREGKKCVSTCRHRW